MALAAHESGRPAAEKGAATRAVEGGKADRMAGSTVKRGRPQESCTSGLSIAARLTSDV